MSNLNFKDLSLVGLRVGLGLLYLDAGWVKVTATPAFSAAGYLKSSTGPLADFFKSLGGNATADQLVMWGLTLGGLALVLGVGTRIASAGLALMMALFYLSHFPPTAPNWYVEDHVIYVLALAVLVAFGAGKVWCLSKFVKLPTWLE